MVYLSFFYRFSLILLALEDGWFKFSQSKFKIFYNKLSWDAAKAHCQSIGGNLASIHSETEERFIDETLLHRKLAKSC